MPPAGVWRWANLPELYRRRQDMTRRRQLLKVGALGATASFTTGAYAQTQPSVRWRMAALYPRSLDTCYGSTEQMCKRVAELTNGKFTIC